MSQKRVASSTSLTVSATASPKTSLILQGFPKDEIIRRLWIKLNLTAITRGGGALQHEPEILGQLVKNISLRRPSTAPKEFKIDVKGISGWTFEQAYRLLNGKRNGLNKVLQAADTSAEHWIEIPFVPNFTGDVAKASRPEGWWLEDMQIDFTLSLADFAVADISNIVGTVDIIYQGETKAEGYTPAEGGLVVKENSDFQSVRKQFIQDFQASLMFLKDRTAFDSISLKTGTIEYYSNFTPTEVESMYPEQRPYPHDEVRTAFQADPLAVQVPELTAGVLTPVDGLVVFDVRNMKDLASPLEIEVFAKTAAVPFFLLGWQF